MLIIDLDQQANTTMCMGFQNPDELQISIANIFIEHIEDKITLSKEQYVLKAEGCDLIPSSIELAGIEPSLVNALSREKLLKYFLEQFRNEDDSSCRCAESGMDNFPRFDSVKSMDCIDVSCFIANETRNMAKIAHVIGLFS